MGLNSLAQQVHSANRKWWYKEDGTKLERNFGEMLALVHSEVSEALEGHRKDIMDDKLPHRKMVEVEMADIIIRVLDICGAYNFDVAGAFAEKMEFNRTREDHSHAARKLLGGKRY